MLISTIDFAGAGDLFANDLRREWLEIESALGELQLHLKESDQEGKQGSPIFDPVGTNRTIGDSLAKLGWYPIPLPLQYRALGRDIDFAKHGVLVEVQFSNYPFLLNNIFRADYFFAQNVTFDIPFGRTRALVLITRGGMFPASNSTLYYEQAERTLSHHFPFTVPTRIVGLQERRDGVIDVSFTRYHSSRYSRTPENRTQRQCRVIANPRYLGCKLELL